MIDLDIGWFEIIEVPYYILNRENPGNKVYIDKNPSR